MSKRSKKKRACERRMARELSVKNGGGEIYIFTSKLRLREESVFLEGKACPRGFTEIEDLERTRKGKRTFVKY